MRIFLSSGGLMMNQRRNNPQEMTITEQLSKVREDVCDKYCKYVYDEEITQEDLEMYCKNCPINKL